MRENACPRAYESPQSECRRTSPEPARIRFTEVPDFASSFALGRDQAPVSRQAWTIGAAGQRVVIEIPHGRLLDRGAVERIIGLAVAIKIGYPYHAPARRKSRPIQAGAENVVVKIPYRRLSCA